MNQLHTNGPMTFTATAAAIVAGRRLFMQSDGLVRHASGAEKSIGTAASDVPASGSEVRGRTTAVIPLNHAGAMYFIASKAIAAGAELGPADDGKVDDDGGLGWANVSQNITADGQKLIAYPLI